MKYGMRERISGVVIVLALAVIFLPMLLDEPDPREERPKPQMNMEKPIEVERQDVESPRPPASVGSMDNPMPQQSGSSTVRDGNSAVREGSLANRNKELSADRDKESLASQKPLAPKDDPIAALAERKQTSSEPVTQPSSSVELTPSAAQGDWSVQAGSFGQADNAKRLEDKLKAQGFDAYRRQRDNNLTTVYVGPYTSSEAGEKARSELKAKANIQGLLVRIDR